MLIVSMRVAFLAISDWRAPSPPPKTYNVLSPGPIEAAVWQARTIIVKLQHLG
jgi:hypothetical protein